MSPLLTGSLELQVVQGTLYDGVKSTLELQNLQDRHLTLVLEMGAWFSFFNSEGDLICGQNMYELNRSRSFKQIIVKKQTVRRVLVDFYLHSDMHIHHKLEQASEVHLDFELNHRIGRYQLCLYRAQPKASNRPLLYHFSS